MTEDLSRFYTELNNAITLAKEPIGDEAAEDNPFGI